MIDARSRCHGVAFLRGALSALAASSAHVRHLSVQLEYAALARGGPDNYKSVGYDLCLLRSEGVTSASKLIVIAQMTQLVSSDPLALIL